MSLNTPPKSCLIVSLNSSSRIDLPKSGVDSTSPDNINRTEIALLKRARLVRAKRAQRYAGASEASTQHARSKTSDFTSKSNPSHDSTMSQASPARHQRLHEQVQPTPTTPQASPNRVMIPQCHKQVQPDTNDSTIKSNATPTTP